MAAAVGAGSGSSAGGIASGIAAAAAAAAAAANEPISMSTTASGLARTFGIIVRQISDLLVVLTDYSRMAPTLQRTLDISYTESLNLQLMIEQVWPLTQFFSFSFFVKNH